MNELIQRARARLALSAATTKAFYARNKILVLGGLTMVSILLIVWARLGFSLDFNRFYAAEIACQTPSPGTHVASTLSVQCGTTQNVLTWNLPSGNDSNTLVRNVDGANGIAIPAALECHTTTTYSDTNIQPGHTYRYVHKAFADRASNAVTCPPPTPTPTPTPILTPTPTVTLSPTPTPTPTSTPTLTPIPTPTPTPTPTTLPVDEPLVCAPAEQTVAVGQPANLTTSGGNGVYRWTSDSQSDEGASAAFSYNTTGSKVVMVTSGSTAAECLVQVVAPEAPTMSLSVLGRNVSSGGPEGSTVGALGGQQVEVIARARNVSAEGILGNVIVRGSLPNGLTYVNGSTTLNNAPVAVDSITTGGLAVGSLGSLQETVVRFRAQINGASFAVGTTQASIVTQLSADGAEGRSGSVVVSVTRVAVGTAPAGTVPTGPGDAVLVALLTSGIVTLLYVSYTHSPFFRRHEAESLSEDQDPMDFRG